MKILRLIFFYKKWARTLEYLDLACTRPRRGHEKLDSWPLILISYSHYTVYSHHFIDNCVIDPNNVSYIGIFRNGARSRALVRFPPIRALRTSLNSSKALII